MKQRELTDDQISVLDGLGYVRPGTAYTYDGLPENFKHFLQLQNAEKALMLLAIPGTYICGGAVRAYHNWQANADDAEVRDVDMYFVNRPALDIAANMLKLSGLTEVANTERAVTFIYGDKPAIQLIKFVYGTIEEVLNEFDYTIVKAGATLTMMVKHTDYGKDLKDRVLHYYGSRLPMASMSRAIKYARYGYKLPAKDMVAVLMDINRTVDFSNPLSVTYHVEAFDPMNYEVDAVGELCF